MKKAILLGIVLFVAGGCATAPSPPATEEKPVVFYPQLPEEPRLQFLLTLSSEDDFGKSQSKLDEFLLGKSETKKKIGKSYDIGSSRGKIYVMDRELKKLVIIDLANERFDLLKDHRLGALADPSGICVTGDDTKYVADMKRQQVLVFDKDNQYSRAYGDKTVFDRPVDVAVHEDTLYVCDMNQNRVLVLDKDSGRVTASIGGIGAETGRFYKPTHVIADRNGNIYVTDAFNFRVQKFDSAGKFLQSFGVLGDSVGEFARPKGIDIDREGHLYVADAAFENVQVFDGESSNLLLFFGGAGISPGKMYLPSGIHIDYENVAYFSKYADKDFRLEYLLYVGNMFGPNKLNIYGYGQWVGPPITQVGK